MWFEIYKLEIPTKINKCEKMIMDCNNKLVFISAKASNLNNYTNDAIINNILYYYFYTKNINLKNKFINIVDNSIFINTDFIDKYKTEPIFYAVCNLYNRIKTEPHRGLPNIEHLSIKSNCNVDENIFTKQKNDTFNVKLFDYQKKTIMRMIEIENNINMEFIRSTEHDINGHKIIWDPHYDTIVESNAITKVKSKGGILSDTMGLGKTITTIGLMHYGKTIDISSVSSPKTYSRATLVIVPSHLSKQWVDEYIKAYDIHKKIVVILTKTQHDKTTYQDIIDADIIIVTIQFISNIKNYCTINFNVRNFGHINYDKRYDEIIRYHFEMLDDEEYLQTTCRPLFECFHFNRIIIDEGHEIMDKNNNSTRVGEFFNHFIKHVDASYKWYISGTPFTSFNGLRNITGYLGIKFTINDEHIELDDNSHHTMNAFIINGHSCIGAYKYMNDYNIVNNFLRTIMIRHLKDDVKDNIKLLGYEEQIEWVELTKSEQSIYNSKVKPNMEKADRRILQQICCHPLIAETYRKIIGTNGQLSLDEVQDRLIEHHTNVVETYTEKIEKLSKTNQAYKMLVAKYKSLISESTFILNTLKKINENIEFNEDDNCIICYENMEKPMMTPCGHIFCDNCIQACLNIKPECPMCKHNITTNTLIDIKKKKSNVPENINPLIQKYGSKLGKLIQMTRTLLAQDARIIIFSQWDDMLTLIGKSLMNNGIDCSFISGNVYKRNKAISRFKMGGNDNSVILLSLEKSASGTNLTEATHIIIVEPIDASKEEIKAIEGQAIGRAVRIGQKQIIKVIRILCKNTIEEEIYNTKYI